MICDVQKPIMVIVSAASSKPITIPSGKVHEEVASTRTVESAKDILLEYINRYSASRTTEEIDRDDRRTFVNSLSALCKIGKEREAIARALDYFDDRLIEGRVAECELTLRELYGAEKLASSVMVSILGITLRTKSLPSRAAFYAKAFQDIAAVKGKKYAKGLLTKYY